MSALVLACEVLAFGSALCYFGAGFAVFGNPNALGAIVGVGLVPILLWGAITAESRSVRQRRFVALALCGGLLYSANSRASIFGAVLVTVSFTVALRKQRLLFQIGFLSIFFLTVMAVFNPSHMDELVSSLTGRVIYKQSGTHSGLFGSRLEPWNDTVAVVKQHPWFGSGFGTSDLGENRLQDDSTSVYTMEGTNREHGNSYLALAEYMGLLGIVPFVILIVLLIRIVLRVFGWIRRTGNAYHPAIPFAMVVAAGLLHAFFEDWLFAVGSYLCVFLWVCAFVLVDLAPEAGVERSILAIGRRQRVVASAAAVTVLR